MGDYLRYWQLASSPYQGGATVYPSPALEEATARIEHLARSGTRTGTLVGEAGSGKSVVLSEAARQLAQQGHLVCAIDCFAIMPRELLVQIAQRLGNPARPADDLPRVWRRVGDALSQQAWQSPGVVLLCDEAGTATADVLQALLRVQHFAQGANCPLCTIVAATPKQATRWPERLATSIDLKIEVFAWDEFTTSDYLQHAAIDAGRVSPLFTEDAMHELHALAQGNPRQVAKLAELALVTGAAVECSIVDSSLVASAQRELVAVLN